MFVLLKIFYLRKDFGMVVYRIFAVLLLMFMFLETEGQRLGALQKYLSNARIAWERRDPDKAAGWAEKALEVNAASLDALLLLADIYHERRMPDLEADYLLRAKMIPGSPALIRYRLAMALYAAGDYERSYEEISAYLNGNPSSALIDKAVLIRERSAFAMHAVANPVGFHPVNLGDSVNTDYDEYWPSLTVDDETLIFTRLLPVPDIPVSRQEDFYISRRVDDAWLSAVPVREINSHLNEGAPAFSADGTLLFFTLCNHPEGRGSCDIWFSRLEGGSWSKPRNAGPPLNTTAWEGQPSLSAFGDVLYFSSNRPGGRGKQDIWSIPLLGWRPDGMPQWGDPVNPGDSINTPGDEISPFIHSNGRDLFFSSDHWPGMGGYDLFRSGRKIDGTWTKAQNLGYPVNTNGHEQGLIIDRTGRTAYMASSREEGKGMDLYTFTLDESMRPDPATYIYGKIVNGETHEPVSAMVRLTGLERGESFEIRLQAGPGGEFFVTLPSGSGYAFHVAEPGYLLHSEYFNIEASTETADPVHRTILLSPVRVGSMTHLYNIFFETGSHQILEASEDELVQLFGLLQQNPFLMVEIQGHTDNVGSELFNLELSEKRALSVLEYLADKGIDRRRLTAKGYGYHEPVESNETEWGRSRNRRTTIRITGVLPPEQQ